MAPNPSSPSASDPHTVACDRVTNQIIKLAEARGIEVRVDVDPDRGAYDQIPATHQIEIAYERHTLILAVDHDTFMNEEFFKTLWLHQVAAAIEELVRADRTSLSSKQTSGAPSALGVRTGMNDTTRPPPDETTVRDALLRELREQGLEPREAWVSVQLVNTHRPREHTYTVISAYPPARVALAGVLRRTSSAENEAVATWVLDEAEARELCE